MDKSRKVSVEELGVGFNSKMCWVAQHKGKENFRVALPIEKRGWTEGSRQEDISVVSQQALVAVGLGGMRKWKTSRCGEEVVKVDACGA